MEFPKVSVIVPVYNTEQYLRECLESLVKQTYSNYEVIIVNDCSPDNSMSIITEYTTEYPDKFYCITPNVNVGIGRARDLGIHHAKGEYIMFVDSDDFVAPTFIEIPVRTMEQADADIVQFGFEFYAVRPKYLYINRIQGGALEMRSQKNSVIIKLTTSKHCKNQLDWLMIWCGTRFSGKR